jgi:hypothetical protein
MLPKRHVEPPLEVGIYSVGRLESSLVGAAEGRIAAEMIAMDGENPSAA